MKKLVLFCLIVLAGCATSPEEYSLYVEGQKALSKDNTMNETAKVSALIEMAKSTDPAVRATAIMLLQQLQQGNKQITIEPPKRFGF